jgi:hypothetical protein
LAEVRVAMCPPMVYTKLGSPCHNLGSLLSEGLHLHTQVRVSMRRSEGLHVSTHGVHKVRVSMSQPRVRPLQHPYTGTIAASIWAYRVGHGQINFIAKNKHSERSSITTSTVQDTKTCVCLPSDGWGEILHKHVGTRISDSTDQWCP